MPQITKQIIAKCDHDNTVLLCEGGYYNVDETNAILVYTCPTCNYSYMNFDGQFIKGRWKVLTPEESAEIEERLVND